MEKEKMEKGKKPSSLVVSDVGAWAMNVVSSVGIIMANKQLMSSSGFAFAFGQFFFFFFDNVLASFLFSIPPCFG